ncbi:MAG: hypothetical protein ABL887_04505 [Nitrosomonas sp.]
MKPIQQLIEQKDFDDIKITNLAEFLSREFSNNDFIRAAYNALGSWESVAIHMVITLQHDFPDDYELIDMDSEYGSIFKHF